MKQLVKLTLVLSVAFWVSGATNAVAQCDNLALDFDGDEDYITLGTNNSSVSGDADFTVEAWFSIASPLTNCTGNFRRLFAVYGSAIPISRFEVGECNSQLVLFWYNTAGTSLPVTPISGTLSPGCHHLAVARNGALIRIHLDGGLSPVYTGALPGQLNTDAFRVGHWGGGATPGQDWQGTVDEVRLWSVARSPQQINDYYDCTLSGPALAAQGLFAYWTFDQAGILPGGPNPGADAADMSGNSNFGTLNSGPGGFLLNGPTSNFVCNTCAPRYQLDITNVPNLFPISLTTICSGEGANFCVTDNFIPATLPAGATVDWQYSDDGGFTWAAVVNPYFTGLCFGLPLGVLDITTGPNAPCGALGNPGYVDRKYRALIKKNLLNQVCVYATAERDLRICCPVTNAQVNFVVQPPTPFNGTLCEAPGVTIDVSLTSSHPYLNPLSLNGNVNVQWTVDGVYDPSLDNMLAFTYTGPATFPMLCFEATIQNCACAILKVQTCIPVDPVPMCGVIDAVSANLMHDPNGGAYDYLICPGESAEIGIVTIPTNGFKNCNPVWQYHLDTDPAGVWRDMLGSSNPTQNTNILPQLSPLNPATSPYLWTSATRCISYRIECRPLHYPNSGCPPCLSNILTICLKPPPPAATITGSPAQHQICKTGFASVLLSVPPGPYTYTWYWNGLLVQSGSPNTFNASDAGCYWVEIADNCQKTVAGQYCIEVCEIIPIIKCPTDNPCACGGLPITLDGCDSYDSCLGTGPFTYTWMASNGGAGTVSGPNGCLFTHIPDPGGTLYTLTVTNSLGCSASSTLFIKPCQ
ncbi:MAG: LamG domain-containing protein [Saprospiraceae bacterium]